MNRKITLVVADDHPVLLKGLIDELTDSGFEVLRGANNGSVALGSIVSHNPDVAILDIEMPLLSGFEVIKKATVKNVKSKFIIFTSHKEKGFVVRAKKLNILGYILKDEPFEELNNCIKSVASGKAYFSKTFNDIVNKEVAPALRQINFLSPSERTIVKLVAQEKTSKEIAEILSVSSRTVEKHRANIISKLNLPSVPDSLSLWSIENKEIILSV